MHFSHSLPALYDVGNLEWWGAGFCPRYAQNKTADTGKEKRAVCPFHAPPATCSEPIAVEPVPVLTSVLRTIIQKKPDSLPHSDGTRLQSVALAFYTTVSTCACSPPSLLLLSSSNSQFNSLHQARSTFLSRSQFAGQATLTDSRVRRVSRLDVQLPVYLPIYRHIPFSAAPFSVERLQLSYQLHLRPKSWLLSAHSQVGLPSSLL